MSDDPRKDEAELIKQAAPLINMMGIAAAEGSGLNEAVKLQLQYVFDQLTHYIPSTPRGWGDDSQMPHEWGSMDTYDDMRNSLRFAALMMDRLCDPFSPPVEDPIELLRELIVQAECGVCAVESSILEAITPEGEEDEWVSLTRTARRLEKEQGLEPNTLFPTDE